MSTTVETIRAALATVIDPKTGKDLVEAMRKEPTRYSLAISSAVGGTHHISFGLPLQSGKVDMSKARLVAFTSTGEGVTALLGGHVDVLSGGTGRDLLISIADKSADVFVFNGTSGADTIQGFEDGFDRIQISGVDSMSQVMIRDAGADVMIRFGTTEITVTNIDHRLITGSDFLLV